MKNPAWLVTRVCVWLLFCGKLAAAPVITLLPQSQTVASGTNLTLQVTAWGTGPLTYQWRKNETDLTDDGRISGSATNVLRFLDVRGTGAGNYAVVVSDAEGTVISATATLNVVLLELAGTWPGYPRGQCQAVALGGGYAYCVMTNLSGPGGAGLMVVDVHDPLHAVAVGGYTTTGSPAAVALSGQYAYLANATAGLEVLDIGNPVAPQRVGSYNTSGYASAVTVAAGFAYVADGVAGLQAIDVSNRPIRFVSAGTIPRVGPRSLPWWALTPMWRTPLPVCRSST
jgi:hypothetical protein